MEERKEGRGLTSNVTDLGRRGESDFKIDSAHLKKNHEMWIIILDLAWVRHMNLQSKGGFFINANWSQRMNDLVSRLLWFTDYRCLGMSENVIIFFTFQQIIFLNV